EAGADIVQVLLADFFLGSPLSRPPLGDLLRLLLIILDDGIFQRRRIDEFDGEDRVALLAAGRLAQLMAVPLPQQVAGTAFITHGDADYVVSHGSSLQAV